MASIEALEAQKAEIIKSRQPLIKAINAITDAKARYIKPIVKAKSRRAALKDIFAPLEEYDYNFDSLQDAYGCESIDEKTYDSLCDLLELYKQSTTPQKINTYHDKVTDYLDEALRYLQNISDEKFNCKIYDLEFQIKKKIREYEKEAEEAREELKRG